ncbi:MAG: sensor histidine kinase [Saprospiraceae bacterium]
MLRLFSKTHSRTLRDLPIFSMKKARSILDEVYDWLSRRPVYHALFWIVLFVILLVNGLQQGGSVASVLFSELVSLIFYAVLVYVNLLYLVPKYLAQRFFLYLVLILAFAALVTPFKVLIWYLWFTGDRDFQQQIVEKQGLVFVGNVLVILLSTVLRVIMDWWRYQGEKQALLTQTMQSELRFLRSQINPHFLFNTLNNLYALTLKKSDKAPEIVLKLSEIMRYMLYECNEKRVYLSKEIQYMQNYLDLERIRQPEGAEIRLVVEGRISEQRVAPLLFVPFLENAFKHGLNNSLQGGGFVRVHLIVQDELLEISIENSKTARMPRREHPRSGGIGLANVRQRLQLLYPNQHELEIVEEPDRFIVLLHLKMSG